MHQPFYTANGVPQVTAPKGSDLWMEQVLAYNNWLDECYASTPDAPEPVTEEEIEEAQWEDEREYEFIEHRNL